MLTDACVYTPGGVDLKVCVVKVSMKILLISKP